MKSEIVKICKEYIRRQVTSQALYAVVRDHLFDSAGDAYCPLTYLEHLDSIKPGDFNPTELATRMDRIFLLYEGARMRAAIELQRFPEIGATYAAWLYYKRFPPAIKTLLKRPVNIKTQGARGIYIVETTVKATSAKFRLREAGKLDVTPSLIAAAVTTPPVLQLKRPKRGRSASSSKEEGDGRSFRRTKSNSSERGVAPDRKKSRSSSLRRFRTSPFSPKGILRSPTNSTQGVGDGQ